MKKLDFTIHINAPREAVWKFMLDKETYPQWTKPFNEGGSSFEGDWSAGSKMLFLGPDPKTGKMGGMISQIAENRALEYVSIKHVGIVTDGVEDMTSPEAKKWTPSFENYTFTEEDGGTRLDVEMNSADEFADMFQEMWPQALAKLKELVEKK